VFTGIVEERGRVVAVDHCGDAARLTVRASLVTSDAVDGSSIAVNGCCLTVAGRDDGTFSADVMAESLDRTALGTLAPGADVNLERALPAAGRLGGHLVQGHVDGTGELVARDASAHWELLRFTLPAALVRYLARQGSIAVDGVSLTVVEVDDGRRGQPPPSFTVSLVPTTLAATTLGALSPGAVVNLEVDVVAKYVERLLAARAGTDGAGR